MTGPSAPRCPLGTDRGLSIQTERRFGMVCCMAIGVLVATLTKDESILWSGLCSVFVILICASATMVWWAVGEWLKR